MLNLLILSTLTFMASGKPFTKMSGQYYVQNDLLMKDGVPVKQVNHSQLTLAHMTLHAGNAASGNDDRSTQCRCVGAETKRFDRIDTISNATH